MSETQSYKTVTITAEQLATVRYALSEYQSALKVRAHLFERDGWLHAAESTNRSMETVKQLLWELSV